MSNLTIIIERTKTIIEKLNTIFGWKKDIVDTMEKDVKVEVKYLSDLKWIKRELEKVLPEYQYIPLEFPEDVSEDDNAVIITLKGTPGFIVTGEGKTWTVQPNGNVEINVGPKVEGDVLKFKYTSKYGIFVNEATVNVVGGLKWKPIINWQIPGSLSYPVISEFVAGDSNEIDPTWLNMVITDKRFLNMMKTELTPQTGPSYSHWYLAIHPATRTGDGTYEIDRSEFLYFDRLDAKKMVYDFRAQDPIINKNLIGDIAYRPSLAEDTSHVYQREHERDESDGNMLVQMGINYKFTHPGFHYRYKTQNTEPTVSFQKKYNKPINHFLEYIQLPDNLSVTELPHIISIVIYQGDKNKAPIESIPTEDAANYTLSAINSNKFQYKSPVAWYNYVKGNVPITEKSSTPPVFIDINNTTSEWCPWIDPEFKIEPISYVDPISEDSLMVGLTTTDPTKSYMMKLLHTPYSILMGFQNSILMGSQNDGFSLPHVKLHVLEDGRYVIPLYPASMLSDANTQTANHNNYQFTPYTRDHPIYKNYLDNLQNLTKGDFILLFTKNTFMDNDTDLKYAVSMEMSPGGDDITGIPNYDFGSGLKVIQDTSKIQQVLFTGEGKWMKKPYPGYTTSTYKQYFGFVGDIYSLNGVNYYTYPKITSTNVLYNLNNRLEDFTNFKHNYSQNKLPITLSEEEYNLMWTGFTGLGFTFWIKPEAVPELTTLKPTTPRRKY